MADYSAKDDQSFQRELLEAVPHLRAYARSLARNVDLADDLVHEVVVKALTAADQFTPGTNFRAWVFTILRHQYLNGRLARGREGSSRRAAESAGGD
jgi:RNA polymerase sigma factor (sigma-70 family)